jgi:hypothetical protein
VSLASRGLRDLEGGAGAEAIRDQAELAVVRAQARRVVLKSVLAGAALTAASLLVP